MSRSRNVAYIKPAEPSFLKAFKSKVGYKEPDGIEAKRPTVPPSGPPTDGDDVERDDELPTVVVLKEGDLEQDDFLKIHEKMKKEKSESDSSPRSGAGEEREDGKITFKKPAKRRNLDAQGGVLDASTSSSSSSKRAKLESSPTSATVIVGGVTRRRRKSSGGESKSRKVKNASLLSFGGEEED